MLTALVACQSRDSASTRGPSRDTSVASESTPAAALALVADTFRARNPAITRVSFVEMSTDSPDSPRRVVVARGIRQDRNFAGDLRDEMFAIVVVNDSFTQLLAVLDVFPAQRWNDYMVHIASVTADSVVVEGRGMTYNDQKMIRRYAW